MCVMRTQQPEGELARLRAENLRLTAALRGIVGIGIGYAIDHIALPAVAERMFIVAERTVEAATNEKKEQK